MNTTATVNNNVFANSAVATETNSHRTPKVSVVVPTLNEAKNLPHVLPRIPSWVYEVILVDGRSSDNTIEVAKELMPNIRVVLETRKGKGAALQAGFAAAKGDIIVMIDAARWLLKK